MKSIVCIVFLFFSQNSFAQNNAGAWDKLEFLVGSWKGEGSGEPGKGEGVFSFKMDLDKNILVRKSHSVYPSTETKPAVVHDDLMIIYRDISGAANKAIYFDNENHVINYTITISDAKDVVFTSDKIPNIPIFRLTYKLINQTTVDTQFEMSQDGEHFFTYVQGRSTRVK